MSCFQFIAAEAGHHPVALSCRVLGVARAGFYAWRDRPPSARARADAELTAVIHRLHAQSRGTYGAPRIHADLQGEGRRHGRKRVARLMRQADLRGCPRPRRQPRTTIADPAASAAPDLVQRAFDPLAPDRLWLADITYIPTEEGWLYLAAVLDAFSRRVVGWAMADHLRTELVLDALELALRQRRPVAGLIHHSDRGAKANSTGRRNTMPERSCDGRPQAAPVGSSGAAPDAIPWSAAGGETRGPAAILAGDPAGAVQRGRRGGGGRLAGGGHAVVP